MFVATAGSTDRRASNRCVIVRQDTNNGNNVL